MEANFRLNFQDWQFAMKNKTIEHGSLALISISFANFIVCVCVAIVTSYVASIFLSTLYVFGLVIVMMSSKIDAMLVDNGHTSV